METILGHGLLVSLPQIFGSFAVHEHEHAHLDELNGDAMAIALKEQCRRSWLSVPSRPRRHDRLPNVADDKPGLI